MGNLDLDGGHTSAPGAAGPAGTGGLVSSDMQAGVSSVGAVVFAITEPRTIKGDGSPQTIPLGTRTFEAETELLAVPRNVPEVFRRVRLLYQGEAPLMPGPIATYVGANHVGAGFLQTIVPGEPIELAFGTDDGVSVERQLVSRNREALGRRATRWTFHYRIVVHNLARQARTVQVLDQVPVSEIDKVEVKLIAVTEGALLDPDAPGIQQWTLKLAPGESRSVDAGVQRHRSSRHAPTGPRSDGIDDAIVHVARSP